MNSPGGRGETTRWDVSQYEIFKRERSRPFRDLLEHIPETTVRLGVDLGCGTGEITAELPGRWPGSAWIGIDSSAEMLEAARARARPTELRFERADLRDWNPPGKVDLVISNSVLHWVPDHPGLMARLPDLLAPGGTLALQMPSDARAPFRRALRDLCRSPRWTRALRGAIPRLHVRAPAWYVETLLDRGFLQVDGWTTTYIHVLPGKNAVVEWTKGSWLRPVLQGLAGSARERFLREYARVVKELYARTSSGILFPYERTFVIASRLL